MDVAAANVLLDAWLGAAKAAGLPASHTLEFWVGHPDTGTQLLDSASVAVVVTVANDGTSWPAAANGRKTYAPTMPGTGDYSGEATHFRLMAGTVEYFVGELDAPVSTSTDTTTIEITLDEDA